MNVSSPIKTLLLAWIAAQSLNWDVWKTQLYDENSTENRYINTHIKKWNRKCYCGSYSRFPRTSQTARVFKLCKSLKWTPPTQNKETFGVLSCQGKGYEKCCCFWSYVKCSYLSILKLPYKNYAKPKKQDKAQVHTEARCTKPLSMYTDINAFFLPSNQTVLLSLSTSTKAHPATRSLIAFCCCFLKWATFVPLLDQSAEMHGEPLSPIIPSSTLPAPALNLWLSLIKYLRSAMIKVHPPHLGSKIH